jgi:glutaredoxin
MKTIRDVLGAILLFLDRIFSPKRGVRKIEDQTHVDQECKSLTIYQFIACPFCIKVRRALVRLNLNIELKNILENKNDYEELLKKGGQDQVPALKIKNPDGSEKFMYESTDIIHYLTKRFPV